LGSVGPVSTDGAKHIKSTAQRLNNAKSVPKNPANQKPAEIVENVLYLHCKYHLGPIRIVWYLARYHGIKISDA
jgi:hypothetical protein